VKNWRRIFPSSIISRWHERFNLNSAYGAIGNQYFRYYNLQNAEAITLSGQLSIRWIEMKMNQYLNKILKTENNDYVIAC
jgi:hypothetical protein